MQQTLIGEHVTDTPLLPSDILFEASRDVPGSVYYSVRRYAKPATWLGDETGQLRYHYEASRPDKNSITLRFCLAGNVYCSKLHSECHQCKAHRAWHCDHKIDSIDFVTFRFSASFLEQFSKWHTETNALTEKMLSFTHSSSFVRTLPLCTRTRAALENLLNHNYSGSYENIFVNAQTQMLLLYSLEQNEAKEPDIITCRFLNNDADREKVQKAREILLQQIGEPLTIKQLSRKVAMNECYLKKGFKEMFGTTIFDFFQCQRMEHAKYLLYEKGLTVTDVANLLGYSSISHFSTAFKRHTGLKPCELLR